MAARAALVAVRMVKLLPQNSGPEQTTSFTKTTEFFELAAWNSQQTIAYNELVFGLKYFVFLYLVHFFIFVVTVKLPNV